MNDSATLDELYEKWRSLTEAEGNAIRISAWAKVDWFQTEKLKLQPQIMNATAEFYEGLNYQPDPKRVEQRIRGTLRELIELERQNSETLADRKRDTQSKLDEIDCTRRNLRHLQRSYAPSREAAWQSYS
jgi:hypothetical protein